MQFGGAGLEKLHGTVRWTVPATSSKTGGNNSVTSPIIHLFRNTRLDAISGLVFLFYVGMIPGTGCCSNFFRCIGFGGGKMPCQIGE